MSVRRLHRPHGAAPFCKGGDGVVAPAGNSAVSLLRPDALGTPVVEGSNPGGSLAKIQRFLKLPTRFHDEPTTSKDLGIPHESCRPKCRFARGGRAGTRGGTRSRQLGSTRADRAAILSPKIYPSSRLAQLLCRLLVRAPPGAGAH